MDHVAVRSQLDRIVASRLFGPAESLCRLLRYLVDHTLDHPSETLKEHRIAIAVFGRPEDFDPRLDAIVRVQIGRLRSRLGEYYSGPGAEDPIRIDIPKGTHVAEIRPRPVPPPTAPLNEVATSPQPEPAGAVTLWRLGMVASLAILLVFVFAYTTSGGVGERARVADAAAVEPMLREFWAPMLRSPAPPVLVYSNAEFVGHPETGMRYFDPSKDAAAPVLDHYTGIGEVLAAVEISRVMARLGHELRVKRGRLLSLDDVRTTNVIFAGSPAENLSLRDVGGTRDFIFERQNDGPRRGHVAIANKRPQLGEPLKLLASAAVPIVEDYALIAMSPTGDRDRWTLLLAGTTTLGTQAAAEFVCRPGDIERLFARLPAGKRSNFEALIRVAIAKGVPVRTEIVAVHALQ